MNDESPKAATPPALPKANLRRFSTVLKMISITILVLLLLIPLGMVKSVLRERLVRRDAAVEEITATWGQEQVVFGPVLIVPYQYSQKALKDQVVNGRVERIEVSEKARGRAFFLPAACEIDGQLVPSRLHRGIYETVVYNGTLQISGTFATPSFEEWNVQAEDVLWNEAEIALSITDLRGAKESLEVKLGDQTVSLKPGSRLSGFDGGVYGRVGGLTGQMESIPFTLSLTLNGSRTLRVAPVGVNNSVQLASSWPDPSFQGAFLPTERTIGPDGFTAQWQVSYYGRTYPQQWTENTPPNTTAIRASLFGVDLVSVVDTYRFVERSIKYGILLIALLFTAFFLFEVLSAIRIHPFQYTLVGIALCMFYLALLALSEFTSFGTAYWTGAAVSVALISLYSAKALRGGRRAVTVALGLAAIYAFLFVILRLQDYSLLVGTAGLFLVLAAVMFVTRNIDWYARDKA